MRGHKRGAIYSVFTWFFTLADARLCCPPRNACPRERLGTTAVLSTLTPALGQPGPEDEHGPSPSAAELQTCQGNLRPDLTIGYPLRRREGLRCVVCRISLADAVSHVGYLQSHVNMFQSICCACVGRVEPARRAAARCQGPDGSFLCLADGEKGFDAPVRICVCMYGPDDDRRRVQACMNVKS
ncbi:hypothetical protein V2G26_020124 [Clonostachys chloroleuca]